MNKTVVCRDVRPATGNSKLCVVIASQDEGAGVRAIDPAAASNFTEVRDRMHAQGIVLGGPLQPAPRSGTQSSPASPIHVIARDEHGKEHRLLADHLEEYSLPSGSTLYYLYVPEAPCDCRWLVGRTLQVVELGGRRPGIAEPGAAEVGGDAGAQVVGSGGA
jgi:hypothetical protein